VISTIGALHRVTPERLAADAAAFAPQVADLPRPYVGVLIGGSNAAFRLDLKRCAHLGALRDLAKVAKMCKPARHTVAPHRRRECRGPSLGAFRCARIRVGRVPVRTPITESSVSPII
jgi:hypothetical protein